LWLKGNEKWFHLNGLRRLQISFKGNGLLSHLSTFLELHFRSWLFVNCDRCWAQNPKERPEAKEIYQILQEITSKELEKYNIGVPGETPRDNEFSKPQQTSSSSQIPNDSSQTTTSKNQSNEGVK
jgi:hypothetical protein